LLSSLEDQCRTLDAAATAQNFDRYRQGAVSLLTDPKVRRALDVTRAPDAIQDRYGRNAFGWSLLMARQLVESGVNLVQVNLGNDETWDTHGNAFPHLRDNLFPPTDQALSALLDDLVESGLLSQTLIVMAGEFGRTPKISLLPSHYKLPGRDHWARSSLSFSPAVACRAAESLANPTRSVPTPRSIRSVRKISLPQSTIASDSPEPSPGRTTLVAPTMSTTQNRSRKPPA
jgi:hypothetical protein